jgi:predicted permease
VRTLVAPARLFSAAAIVLLFIVWANVAGLFLARAAGRQRETATRVALGASRGRLAAESLTEGFLIAVMGGALGLIGARSLGLVLGSLVPAAGPAPAIHFRTFLFAWGLTLMTTLIVGLVPGRLAARRGVLGFLDHRASPTSGWRTISWRRLLTVAQLGLSLVALFVAGLCLRSAARLDAVDTGIDDGSVLLATFDAAAAGHNPASGARFYEALQERVAALPGIANTSFTHIVPFEGRSDSRTLGIPGYLPAADESMNVSQNWVGPHYFATLGVPLLRGREFRSTDRAGAAPVVIVNEALARRFWPSQDPIGKTISYAGPGDHQVIGLVMDHRSRTPAEPATPMIYLPSLQRYQGVLTLVARASAEGAAQAAAIRDAARSLDPRMAPYNIRTLAAEKGRSLSGRRGAAEIASVFGILCLVVSAVGLYGVMAQAVRQRTREIAIRIALGAAQTRTTVLVLRDAMILVGAALVPGLAGAFLASRLVSSMLYESEAIELLTVAAVIAILGVVALAAAWIPARRAATVNPIVALRGE